MTGRRARNPSLESRIATASKSPDPLGMPNTPGFGFRGSGGRCTHFLSGHCAAPPIRPPLFPSNMGAQGRNPCEQRSACMDLDGQWFRRHGAPRRNAPWLPQPSSAPQIRHGWNSRHATKCGNHEIVGISGVLELWWRQPWEAEYGSDTRKLPRSCSPSAPESYPPRSRRAPQLPQT